ncbi:uncharacterized protein GGS22DRAFT_149038 [Annulohypoxylon maeteangense]|uniref:uncharacterized protein n=1 Tax=Annulohypoxylon maeteangense TaxID=1927788 RepID=UPI00200768F8|nr:uncharacterized protein GGS22DRAFT_149038 [Annulohypoxylon maeteangense]KAI0889738.1 hypothetical protein GGS22DRAFT_149038 [Annulohypoxylon maeteangense]
MASQDLSAPFTLYSYTYSICALMVQMAYEMRGSPREGRPDLKLERKMVDIGLESREQLSEFYLLKVNPKGVVPVLANEKVLDKPMPESIDISYYLADWYPSLLPVQHKEAIRELLEELHKISFKLLTFGTQTKYPSIAVDWMREQIQRPDISDEYKKALEYKAGLTKGWADNHSEADLAEAETRARAFCAKIIALMEKRPEEKDKITYIFGPEPTLLDAHVVVFLGRVYEKKRFDLLPPVLVQWHEQLRKTGMWERAVPAGTTLPPMW